MIRLLLFTLHCLTHDLNFPDDAIAEWAEDRGYEYQSSFAGETLPSIDEFDGLILLGGFLSPWETERYPFLTDEIALIQKAIYEDKTVIGFCLGGQLIGDALGASTTRGQEKEVGFHPIRLTQAAKTDPIFHDFPENFDVLLWHQDVMGVPKGAVLLASSEACPNQAFRYGNNVYAFQFHLEVTKPQVEALISSIEPSSFKKRDTEISQQNLHTVLDRIVSGSP